MTEHSHQAPANNMLPIVSLRKCPRRYTREIATTINQIINNTLIVCRFDSDLIIGRTKNINVMMTNMVPKTCPLGKLKPEAGMILPVGLVLFTVILIK